MIRWKTLTAAVAVGSLLASAPALAQTTDETMAVLLEEWITAEAADFAEDIRAYGLQCMLPGAIAMPEAAKLIIVRENGMEPGLTALQTENVEAFVAFAPTLQECVETMFVGEQIAVWTAGEAAGAPPETIVAINACLMEAIRPLTSEAKQIIFVGENFEDGAETLIEERPELAEGLDARLEACF